MDTKQPKPPAGLGVAGRARWKELVDPAVEFRPDELVLIAEACHVVDTLADLRSTKPQDVGEVRRQQEQLRKLLAGVDWLEGDEADKPLSQWGRTLANRRWRGAS